jgi:hypothetical protein
MNENKAERRTVPLLVGSLILMMLLMLCLSVPVIVFAHGDEVDANTVPKALPVVSEGTFVVEGEVTTLVE